ncbi:MAG: SDR family NAD(P)-dependent oxidoreductase [Thermoleophilia bacterium]|nr:SDR family NAD(P)-dependent oxidoreductase [Thermoleophilia bacterium]
MDLTVVPGFSTIGYGLRRRMFGWQAPDVAGRSVMVTGANAGLGKATCLELARCGAEVHMVCRSREKGRAALAEISSETGAAPQLHICDLSDLDSVREFATGFLESGAPLDVLINNAGVMPPERTQTAAGFEVTFATNVLGPFLLTELLLPRLEESGSGRVVMMSSGGMYSSGFDLDDPQLQKREYSPTGFYAQSKRAEVMLADEWDSRAGAVGPVFCSMHPGWAVTPGMSAALPGFHRVTGPILRDTAEGADTAVWLAGAGREEAPGGEFYQDREPRPKYRMPQTRESSGDRKRLYELCAGLTGIAPT